MAEENSLGEELGRDRLRWSRRARVAVGRDGFDCPMCNARPPFGPFWPCSACGAPVDPFDIVDPASEAVCHVCRTSIAAAGCVACGAVRPLLEWRLSHRASVVELPGGVVRFRTPQSPSATPVVIATCLSFFSATTTYFGVRAAGAAPTFAFTLFVVSVLLAARAAILLRRFQQSRRAFERAMHDYQTAGTS